MEPWGPIPEPNYWWSMVPAFLVIAVMCFAIFLFMYWAYRDFVR